MLRKIMGRRGIKRGRRNEEAVVEGEEEAEAKKKKIIRK